MVKGRHSEMGFNFFGPPLKRLMEVNVLMVNTNIGLFKISC